MYFQTPIANNDIRGQPDSKRAILRANFQLNSVTKHFHLNFNQGNKVMVSLMGQKAFQLK